MIPAHSRLALVVALSSSMLSSVASAQTPPAPWVQRAGYSIPWGLRPAIAPNLIRLDSSVALHDQGAAAAFVFTGGARPFGALPDLGLYGRIALAQNSPDHSASGTALGNPMLLALWTPRIADVFRLSLAACVTFPVGMGGGGAPDPAVRAATLSGIWTRSSIDSALFASNFAAVMAGAGFAYVARGLTVQAEVTLLELVRTRGEAVEPDENRLNFTTGMHVGFRVIPSLTVSAEARYQRWLSTPKAVENNSLLRDQLTAGLGLRANLPLGPTTLLRPGVAYFHPFGGYMGLHGYGVLSFDLALAL